MNISPLPMQKFFDNNGNPLVRGRLFTYIAGTTTKLASYQDQAGTLNTNPIVLDFRGEARVWLDQTLTYKFVLAPPGIDDPPTNPIWTVDNISAAVTIASLTAAILGAIIFPLSPQEQAAGLGNTDIRDFSKYYGDVRRFAVLDGVVDDTAAIQKWALVTGEHTFPIVATALISSAISLASNSSFELAKGVIKTATTNISMFVATSKSNIQVSGGKFLQTAAGANANIGQLVFDACTNVTAENSEYEGAQWAAIWLNNTEYFDVSSNYIHGGLGTVQDSADINVYTQCRYGSITRNKCVGGGYVGILVQDPGAALIPSRIVIAENYVGAHSAYGIARYNIDGANSFDIIDSNVIEGITGVNPSGAGGNGIYIQNSGGVIASNNDIRNCCTATSAVGLTPAGIGVNNVNSPFAVTFTAAPVAGATSGTLTSAWTRASGVYNVLFVETAGGAIEIRVATLTNGLTAVTWVSGLTNNCNAAATTAGQIPPTITGNTISDIALSNTNAVVIAMVNVSSSTAGANISANTFFQGAGSVAAIACTLGVFVNGANNVIISANRFFFDPNITNSSAILLFANGGNISGFTITGNLMQGCSFGGIYSASSAAFTISNVSMSGNTHFGGGAACVSYRLGLMNDAVISSNVGNATVQPLDVNTCLRLRFTGNSFISAGANAVTTSGTCTGGYFDKSNYAAGSGGAGIESIQNAATGFIVEQLGNAAPAANNRAVGDRVEQSVPVVGNSKGWRTTVAGAPGTQVSEGNL